jgi:hypothetical protein
MPNIGTINAMPGNIVMSQVAWNINAKLFQQGN